MFFNEKGILNIDEMVANNDSFKRILEHNTVDENETKEQSDQVVAMLHQMEKEFSEEQLLKVKELLVETSVLYAIYNYYSIQHLNQ